MTDLAESRLPSVYKILTEAEHLSLARDGGFDGNAADLRDGFVHLAFADQIVRVVKKHFVGQAGLVLLELSPGEVAAELRVEASSGGALYPHLYRALRASDVLCAVPLQEFLEAEG